MSGRDGNGEWLGTFQDLLVPLSADAISARDLGIRFGLAPGLAPVHLVLVSASTRTGASTRTSTEFLTFSRLAWKPSSLENDREFEASKHKNFSTCSTHGYYTLRNSCIWKSRSRGSFRDLKVSKKVRKKLGILKARAAWQGALTISPGAHY